MSNEVKVVQLKGEALAAAREMEEERLRVNARLEREAEIYKGRTTALLSGFSAFVDVILPQICKLAGWVQSDSIGVDNRYYPQTGVLFLYDTTGLLEVDDLPGEDVGAAPAVPEAMH